MPQAILLHDHETLGGRGTVVDVSKGYLRNYLIPRKLAEPATKGSVEAAKRRLQPAEQRSQHPRPDQRHGATGRQAVHGRREGLVRQQDSLAARELTSRSSPER